MRSFIILCLSAVALAAPQGYSYNPGATNGYTTSHGLSQGSTAGSGFLNVAHHTAVQHPVVQQVQQVQQIQHQPQVQAFFNQGGHQQVQQVQHQQMHHQHPQAVISKRFFIHTAPEDIEEEFKEKVITVGVPKKNYNVVFIKAPSRSNKKTALKISPAVNEEKTVIYVLTKKTDTSDLITEVVDNVAPTTKPEVFFIKYKTNEEASHAQEQIQAQYDSLGGSSQVTDEGVAPVTSVVGSLSTGDAATGGATVTSTSTGTVTATNNAYLPPGYH